MKAITSNNRKATKIGQLLLVIILGSWSLPALAQPQTLITPNFRIKIERLCPEGTVVCDHVRYQGSDRETGNALELMGRTHHTMGADGITPSRFLGYIFKNGEYQYFISTEGQLRVLQGQTVLLEEVGEWQK